MRITFHGGVGGVTGSAHLLESDGERILLDCGLFQGKRAESRERNRNLPFDASAVKAVVLGHAHIDHCGNLPNLVRSGFEGDIHATVPTASLCDVMLRDSARIQEQDAAYLNEKNAKKGEPPVEPIYTGEDVERTLPLLVGHAYRRRFYATERFRATFFEAGHILGAALTLIEFRGNGGKSLRLGYLVDLGRKGLPLLRDPEMVPDLDAFIIESTYGDRLHDDMSTTQATLADVLRRTVGRGGKVIIPAFALERTQELLWCLSRIWKDGLAPKVPVFVDSPLAINVTEIFRFHQDYLDDEYQAALAEGHDPFELDGLSYTRTVEESRAINKSKEPCIIISASGMCEVGRILHHLKHNIEDERNTILVVGFMAKDTLGRRIVEGQEPVRIFGEEYKLRAEVVIMNSFSAHADRNELLSYAGQYKGKVGKVFVVHGEEKQAEALAQALRESVSPDVVVPQPGDSAEF